jgi:toxin ParE1/3/4
VIVRFTRPAARQLEDILDHIATHSPHGASKVFDRIDEMIALVLAQPGIGRATNRPGFRRINLHPYPYAILYRAHPNGIVIHAIRHAARRSTRAMTD